MFAGLYGPKIHDASFRRPASLEQHGSEQERRNGNSRRTPGIATSVSYKTYAYLNKRLNS